MGDNSFPVGGVHPDTGATLEEDHRGRNVTRR
jgi:hypothetical protein